MTEISLLYTEKSTEFFETSPLAVFKVQAGAKKPAAKKFYPKKIFLLCQMFSLF